MTLRRAPSGRPRAALDEVRRRCQAMVSPRRPMADIGGFRVRYCHSHLQMCTVVTATWAWRYPLWQPPSHPTGS